MSGLTGWPISVVEIEGFPGWEAEVRDLTVAEVEDFEEVIRSPNMANMIRTLLPVVQRWSFTDSSGVGIPLTEEGCRQAPMKVISGLLMAILGKINEQPLPKEMTTSES